MNAVDNSIIPKTPNLSYNDTLVFDGIDGVSFHANKIMLRNRFTENIDTQYEVVEIQIDESNGFGKIPITTNSIDLYESTTFQFKYYEGN